MEIYSFKLSVKFFKWAIFSYSISILSNSLSSCIHSHTQRHTNTPFYLYCDCNFFKRTESLALVLLQQWRLNWLLMLAANLASARQVQLWPANRAGIHTASPRPYSGLLPLFPETPSSVRKDFWCSKLSGLQIWPLRVALTTATDVALEHCLRLLLCIFKILVDML